MGGTNHRLDAVLLAAAGELTDLAVFADGLGVSKVNESERWQGLDRLSQHLSGIAAFLTVVAAAVPAGEADLSGAFALLTTQALADRLAGQSASKQADGGSMEFFDA